MIYTIAMLVLLAGIVFFHYLEGFFSATVSAIFAVIAAAVAVGYHEVVVTTLLGGRFASESHALVLMLLFAVTYLFLRLIFDRLIQGNVRLPVVVDKVGAAVMGVVAGFFALGVVTIAAQELPFGPDVAGYTRYAVAADRDVPMHVAGFKMDQNPVVSEELVSDDVGQFDPAQAKELLPPMDDCVVGLVSWLSNGSLAGAQPLKDIHPDLLQELFGQRIGIEAAANHTALNIAGETQVSVLGVYTVSSSKLQVVDQFDPKLRAHPLAAIATIADLDKQEKDKMLLVVRTQFTHDAADADIVRFSPGSIRLVAPQSSDLGGMAAGDYYPIGTLEDNTLYVDKPDDYLFLNLGSDHAVDLVFKVDRWKPDTQMPGASFLEAKRLARVDLGGQAIATKAPVSKVTLGVYHVASGPSAAALPPQPGQPAAPRSAPAAPPIMPTSPQPTAPPVPGAPQVPGAPPAPAPPQPQSSNPLSPHSLVPGANGASVLDVQDVSVTSALPQRLGTAAGAHQLNTAIAGGNAILRDGKAKSLTIDGSPAATDASKGDIAITDLSPPAGQTLIRITAKPGSDNSWAWASHVKNLNVVDASGTTYAPKGVWASITVSGGEHLMAQYAADFDLDEITPSDGTVTSVVLYVAVPTGTVLKSLTLDGKQIMDLAGKDTSH